MPELPANFETWVSWLTYAPLVAASVVGFSLTMIKLVEFGRHRALAGPERDSLWRLIEGRELGKAMAIANGTPSPAMRMVAALLGQAERSSEFLRDRAEQVGGLVTRELEAGLGGLALIGTLGPLFGLFGTVVGITLVFNRLAAAEGGAGPEQLAAGISTALYTTIFGLIVGVFALVFHRYFTTRLDRIVAELESVSLDVVERLTERRQ